jgi:hypothetical protein
MSSPAADSPAPTPRAVWAWLLLASAVSLLMCHRVATRTLDLGSFEGRWVYRHFQPLSLAPLGIWFLTSIAALDLLRVRLPDSRRGEWLLVLAWVAVATVIDAALRTLTPIGLTDIFGSADANSFYTATRQQPIGDVLGDFERARLLMPLHAQSNLPGKMVLLYALETLTVRPALLAWLLVLLSNLGAFLMYGFVRGLFGERMVALYAAVLYLVVPARIFFFPLMNTITPLLVLGFGCALLRWLRVQRAGDAATLGVLLFALVFFEPLPLVCGLLFAAVVLRAIGQGQIGWRKAAAHIVLMIVAFGATVLAVRLATGFDLIRAFAIVGSYATAFNEQELRPYDVWIKANLVEFVFGTGAAQVVLLFAAAAAAWLSHRTAKQVASSAIGLVVLSLVAVLAVLDLIGINRGEVIRLWIFLACLMQIPAAWFCAHAGSGRVAAISVVVSLSLLTAALGTAVIGFVRP